MVWQFVKHLFSITCKTFFSWLCNTVCLILYSEDRKAEIETQGKATQILLAHMLLFSPYSAMILDLNACQLSLFG